MAVIKYDKLVRDKIPDIIETSGKKCVTSVLSEEEYLKKIDEKLAEELEEYYKDRNLEELADLVEVIYAAVKARGYTLEELELCRKKKADERGAFEKRILLESVSDKEV